MKERKYVFVLIILLCVVCIVGICFALHHAEDVRVGDKVVNYQPTTFEVRYADPDEYVGFSIQVGSSDKKITVFTTRDRWDELKREIEVYNCEKKK